MSQYARDGLHNTEWWKVACMELDCLDFLDGNITKEQFIEFMKYDIEEISKKVDALGEKER